MPAGQAATRRSSSCSRHSNRQNIATPGISIRKRKWQRHSPILITQGGDLQRMAESSNTELLMRSRPQQNMWLEKDARIEMSSRDAKRQGLLGSDCRDEIKEMQDNESWRRALGCSRC